MNEVHRIYMEQVEIKEGDEFSGWIACGLDPETCDFNPTVTTNNDKVTCPDCLDKIMEKKNE